MYFLNKKIYTDPCHPEKNKILQKKTCYFHFFKTGVTEKLENKTVFSVQFGITGNDFNNHYRPNYRNNRANKAPPHNCRYNGPQNGTSAAVGRRIFPPRLWWNRIECVGVYTNAVARAICGKSIRNEALFDGNGRVNYEIILAESADTHTGACRPSILCVPPRPVRAVRPPRRFFPAIYLLLASPEKSRYTSKQRSRALTLNYSTPLLTDHLHVIVILKVLH